MPFRRILIANRGEIASRIMQTCRRLGIETVAVYSEADARARHTRMADQAVLIGPATAAESYLNQTRILQAAKSTSAEAIHPGYGFLSENAEFARAVGQAGLVFIGPSPETIQLMGSKAEAKAIMRKAGVPLVPGYHGHDQSDETLALQAEKIGYPLMLKAAAGGGGKGMRVVEHPHDFDAALAAARREAQSAFGDERMILERCVQRPKHIEAQIFGDTQGQVVHLFERDCSSQRRHQKVIEEAPAAGINPKMRDRLLIAAAEAATAVNYIGAGTVEFLVDEDHFYFLEMNTRLQVEHPVTELITGQDLVEWQLLVAAGQPLPLSQQQITRTGHAMEARIYAEDASVGFLPDSGQITALAFPEDPWVRTDAGVDAGDQVSIHYDPMIAKLIVRGANRDTCLHRLKSALAQTQITGPTTNLDFLLQLAARPEFEQAKVDTNLLDRALDQILDADAEPPLPVLAAAAQAFVHALEPKSTSLWARRDGWRLGKAELQRLDIKINQMHFDLEIMQSDDALQLVFDGQTVLSEMQRTEGPSALLSIDQKLYRVLIHQHDANRLDIVFNQRRWPVVRCRRFESIESNSEGSGRVLAPMPGKVLQIQSEVGQMVTSGTTLALMEAMKMELSIKAEVSGTIAAIAVAEGDLIEAEALMIEIEPE